MQFPLALATAVSVLLFLANACNGQPTQVKNSENQAITQANEQSLDDATPKAPVDWNTIAFPASDPPIPPNLKVNFPEAALANICNMPVEQLVGYSELQARSLLKENMIVPDPLILVQAAGLGQTRLTIILIKAGLNPNISDPRGFSPLSAACEGGYLPTAQAIYALGGELENPIGPAGHSAIHSAAATGQADVVKWLVTEGMKLDTLDRDQHTPLLLACASGNVDLVKWLVEHGADIKAVNERKMTALHFGMRDLSLGVVKLLVEQYELNIEARDGEKGLTPAGYAVLSLNAKGLEYLAEKGAKLDVIDHRGYGLVHTAVLIGSVAMIESLEKLGASLETRTVYEGRTPLMLAAVSGNQYLVNLLLKLGADVWATDNGGMNALEINAAQPPADSRAEVDQAIRDAMQAKPQSGESSAP